MLDAGRLYEKLGERDQALRWLGRALDLGYPRASIENSASLTDLRLDPRTAGDPARLREAVAPHIDAGRPETARMRALASVIAPV